jgi:hypothetical protein
MNNAAPKIVWSLDFELRWGMHDRLGMNRDGYRRNLEGAREAVPLLLKLFVERRVRATWATVGALGCEDWSDYFRRAPPPPRYADARLAVSPSYAELDPDGVLHFAPDLVAQVARSKGQDLGTHTFSHLFLGEVGVMKRDAEADHAAVTELFRTRYGVTPTSLVFPRNQIAFLEFYRAHGITAWRTNEKAWYFHYTQHAEHRLLRALRIMDALTPLAVRGGEFIDGGTRSTLFVRVTLPELAWRAHLAKIKLESLRLKPGEVLHFWVHPHNLGGDVRRGMSRIEQVLDAVERRVPKGTAYASMRDLGAETVAA